MRPPWALLLLPIINVASSCLLEDGRSAVYLSVFENVEPGEVIGELPLVGDASELRLVRGAELVELRNRSLVLLSSLDRDEGLGKFDAIVECKSKDESEFAQVNISVFVTVKDVNDNAPLFDQETYDVDVFEELPVGTIVFTEFEATDKDQPGPNSFVQYALLEGPNSKLLSLPDPFRPLIRVASRIDFETLRDFSVTLEARDQGEPPRASLATLHVRVVDVDDLPPVFAHNYYLSHEVHENFLVMQPAGVHAEDGDALKEDIVYSLSGELSEHFSIDQHGSIRSRNNPAPPDAVFFVHATQVNNDARNSTAIVRLNLRPQLYFEHDLYSAKIFANSPQLTQVAQVLAFADNTSSRIRYQLEDQTAIVTVDENTGKVFYRGVTVKKNNYTYNITATDGRRTAVTRLNVIVEKDGECGMRWDFEREEYHFQVGALPVVGIVKAKPLGDTRGSPVYTLLNLNKEFTIDAEGVLRIVPGANPQCTVCQLVITVSDGKGRQAMTRALIRHTPSLLSTASLLTILILIILVLIFLIFVVFIIRRIVTVWRNGKRQNVCWMNKTSDSGVIITGSLQHSQRYVLSEDKDRDCSSYDVTKSPSPIRIQGAQLVPVTVANAGQTGTPTVYF